MLSKLTNLHPKTTYTAQEHVGLSHLLHCRVSKNISLATTSKINSNKNKIQIKSSVTSNIFTFK